MRMKEICEKTGLTDRAVRLYISSGLLAPKRSTSYNGYTSIHFSQEDLKKLESIAVLRRAGFSMSDIREIQNDASCITGKIQSRCSELEKELAEKSMILKALSASETTKADSVDELAALLKEPAGSASVPKEDSIMRKISKKCFTTEYGRLLHCRFW
jgi:DNA-binding transcriptional MerR regulator